jgi:hypothetical protein
MYAFFAPLGTINLRLFGVPLKRSVNLLPLGGLFPLNTTLVKLLQLWYLQPIITQYFIDNKSEIWLLFLIAHSKR